MELLRCAPGEAVERPRPETVRSEATYKGYSQSVCCHRGGLLRAERPQSNRGMVILQLGPGLTDHMIGGDVTAVLDEAGNTDLLERRWWRWWRKSDRPVAIEVLLKDSLD